MVSPDAYPRQTVSDYASGNGLHAPGIILRNVSKYFGRLWALREVSLAIAPGEFLAVLGQNGAGKTTLLRILALLSKPSSGEIRFDGASTGNWEEEARRSIGYVGHSSFLYEELTTAENLRFYARLYGLRPVEPRVQSLLEMMSLETRADELVRNLSRGMRQRAAIARALLHDPSLLLFDEPFTGLDALSTQSLMAALGNFRAERRTVIVSTHHLEEVLPLATRAVILERGEAVYDELNRPEAAGRIRDCLARTAEVTG